MDDLRWTPTGVPQHVSSDYQIKVDAIFEAELARAVRAGNHYWLAIVGYKVDPPVPDGASLDHENLRQFPVVGCYLCEEPYTKQLAEHRCRPISD